ncbi:arylamine N-acetyltransferase family protein [Pseudoalteromonas spongiae]|uniref:arylamine N-acetyltransferase family protein n=1 Tax=Pseudoalteromonas spongiae TaxID=298657 RepID=UPI00026C94D7|nr:arylamine N-acetyltransferase [Pseudoalteromonas spongiae]ATD01599.1 N-hydroxyarylamine O-acetyltransferase [Pseudoalteromonas spongiae UST010723-006]
MEQYVQDYLNQLNVAPQLQGLALISALYKAHIATFPFNSANVILKENLSLEPEALFDRVVTNRRGGYCFEHNKVFYLALKALGFTVRPLITRVLLDGNEQNGRLHRVTLLEYQGKQYIVDVGFGVLNPRFIVPLKTTTIDAPNGRYSLEQTGEQAYRLALAPNNDQPITLYRFDLSEFTEMDCNIGHFYSSQHENAAFVNNLVVSRIMDNERILIRNNQVTFFDDALNQQEVFTITSPKQLHSLLTEQCLVELTFAQTQTLFEFINRER